MMKLKIFVLKMLKNIMITLGLWTSWTFLHELVHFLIARFYGFPARIEMALSIARTIIYRVPNRDWVAMSIAEYTWELSYIVYLAILLYFFVTLIRITLEATR